MYKRWTAERPRRKLGISSFVYGGVRADRCGLILVDFITIIAVWTHLEKRQRILQLRTQTNKQSLWSQYPAATGTVVYLFIYLMIYFSPFPHSETFLILVWHRAAPCKDRVLCELLRLCSFSRGHVHAYVEVALRWQCSMSDSNVGKDAGSKFKLLLSMCLSWRARNQKLRL